jgi:hypothetical protein
MWLKSAIDFRGEGKKERSLGFRVCRQVAEKLWIKPAILTSVEEEDEEGVCLQGVEKLC